MDWQQKFAAINALCRGVGASLKMRNPGDWYVSIPVEIGDGHFLTTIGGSISAPSPVDAVEEAWNSLTRDLKPTERIIVGAGSPDRRAVRWNGFMWVDVPEPERDAA